MCFFSFLELHPSTKMAITPLLIDQIEKFQCLELSTAPKLWPGTFRIHVARVTCPETWLEVSKIYKWINPKFPNKRFQNHWISSSHIYGTPFLAKKPLCNFFCRKPKILMVWGSTIANKITKPNLPASILYIIVAHERCLWCYDFRKGVLQWMTRKLDQSASLLIFASRDNHLQPLPIKNHIM